MIEVIPIGVIKRQFNMILFFWFHDLIMVMVHVRHDVLISMTDRVIRCECSHQCQRASDDCQLPSPPLLVSTFQDTFAVSHHMKRGMAWYFQEAPPVALYHQKPYVVSDARVYRL